MPEKETSWFPKYTNKNGISPFFMERRVYDLEARVEAQEEELKRVKRLLFTMLKTDEHLSTYADEFR